MKFRKSLLPPRFWAKVVIPSHADYCWEWTGARSPAGYGRVWRFEDRKPIGASRWVLEVKLGRTIPRSMDAMHTCDNPPCVNPAHLIEGSRKENLADMTAKGRRTHGETHPNSVLTAGAVMDIRKDARPRSAIAADYGISPKTVGKIKRRESWRHLA